MGIRSQEQVALLTDYEPASAYSEAYYTIYTNICLNWDSTQQQHTLLLTTPSAYPELSAVAANVAIAAAQSGTPTLLVDADLRTPTLRQRFGLGEQKGLAELLRADTVTQQDIESAVSRTFIPELSVLGAGNPGEDDTHHLSARLQNIIDGLYHFSARHEQKPGLIIFTSPAVLAGPDVALIGALVEQTLLVIVAGHTTRVRAKQAQEQLQQAHVKPSGIIVLNV